MNKTLKILFVEDNITDAEIIRRQLTKSGIKEDFRLADDPDSYLDYLGSFRPDLIISDYSMPQFTGMEALMIRNDIAPSVPFILVTGSVNEEVAVDCIKSGADDYILKDKLSRLPEAVKSALVKAELILKNEESERALLESAEFNSALLDTIPFGMDITDTEGTVMFQSEKLAAITGGRTEGRKCWEAYLDRVKQCGECPVKNGLNPGETLTCEAENAITGKFFEIIHTGITFKGKKALLNVYHDITRRKQTEGKLIESETYYRTLTDLSPDGIIMFDFEGTIKYASRKVYDIVKEKDDTKITGTSMLEWVSPDYHELVMMRIKDILSGIVDPEIREYKLLRADKQPFWAELSSSPLPFAGGPGGLLVVIRDITERKKVEDELIIARDRAEESDRLKTAFIHNISHEIRTPMNAIVGFTALLSDLAVDEGTRNTYVELIMNSSNHLLSILNDIIDISNIEANIVRLNMTTVNICRLVQSVHDQLKKKAENKGLSFKCDILYGEKESTVITDGTKLQQVLINLVDNAIKFTSAGLVKFGYHVRPGSVDFYVTDTGIGIPEDKQQKIFERFYQVEEHTTKVYEGTGLGLSISKSYVELLGGSIGVMTKQGTGSTFYFNIPVSGQGREQRQESEDGQDLKFRFLQKRRILVAEDVDSNFKLVNYFLKGLNTEIIRASDGQAAVDIALSDDKIDLILMDIKMPVMNGLTATRIIREKKPAVPIIALTAYTDDKEKAMESGCSSFIAKPFDKRRLLEVLKDYI
ncbi:MAG TPA: response regulator [Bacteroidales bacterium]|nr:response regulator [Bacteroidales bacterium]